MHAADKMIDTEYERVLVQYHDALKVIERLVAVETEAITLAIKDGTRFSVRHAIGDAALRVLETEHKLKVFSNFVWEHRKR